MTGSWQEIGIEAQVRYRILHDLAANLLAQQSLPCALNTVVLDAVERLGFTECVIFLWDSATERLVAKASRGSARHQRDPELIRQLRRDEGIVGAVFSAGRAIVLDDTSKDPRYLRDLIRGRSELTVPITYSGETIGVLDSEHPDPGHFGPEHIESMTLIAALVAPKIISLRALEQARQWEKEHEKSRRSMREMLSTAPNVLYVLDYDSKLMVEGLDKFSQFLGFSVLEIEALDEGVYSLIHPDDVTVVAKQESSMRACPADDVFPIEVRLRRKSGDYRWCLINSKVFKRDSTGAPRMEVGSVTDITSLKMAQAELRRKEQFTRGLFENGFDGIVLYDRHANIQYAGPSVRKFLGFEDRELIGSNALDNVVPDDHAESNRAWFDLLNRPGGHAVLEQRIRHKHGREIWIEARLTNRLHDPLIAGIISNFHDITDRKKAERRIYQLANYDSLTGLPNRRLLLGDLAEAMVHARRRRTGAVLIYMDLDRFKDVNDTLGHDIGDLLLQRVASAASAVVGDKGLVARLGGDEFAVVMEDASIRDGTRMASALIDAMESPFKVRDYDIRLTASVGVARFPEHGDGLDELCKHADIAMYRAKARRNRFAVFEIDDARAMADRVQLEKDLHAALDRDEFELYYQPRVDVNTLEQVGVEALIRWHRPHGIVLPGDFIPVAEETGLIYRIGEWVLNAACEQAAAWHEQGHNLRVAVNVSARELLRSDVVEHVAQALDRHCTPPELLEIELTETAAMTDLDVTIRAMHSLREIGVRLAIDDFGTGHSSLSYLRHLPVDYLKIDQSFLPQGGRDQINQPEHSVMTGIVLLTQSVGLIPVAEGVESEDQMAFLRAVGCREAQGFWLARPMPANQVTLRSPRVDERRTKAAPKTRADRGFTLMELLVAIAIVGILTAIAYPTYLDQVRKGRRSEAMSTLQDIALQQENWRTNDVDYASAAELGAPNLEFYDISVSNVSATTYTITATAIGDQAVDADGGTSCEIMSINAATERLPAACWR